ncbi:hypothetical protein [Methylobacterium sp. 1973]|uniref:hypothetical protein n=1 Tax=Methylobacterium sp. 1973 TaxID=3156421 RepID=UPI003390800A
MAPIVLPIALTLALAAVASITVPAAAVTFHRTEKVYGADGRRVAVIKRTNFGTKMYRQDGRRIATIKGGR